MLPMDEVLTAVAVDLSGRPYLVCDASFTAERVGGFDTEMVREFFYAVSYSAGMNLHIKVLSGVNNHHIKMCIRDRFETVGKRGLYLKRLSMGPLVLDEKLPCGAYRALTKEEIAALFEAAGKEVNDGKGNV